MFSAKKMWIAVVAVVAVAGAGLVTVGADWLAASGFLGQEKALETRVNGYWAARVDADVTRMANYVSPGEAVPDPGMLMTESFTLNELAVEGDEAQATLTVQSRVRHPLLAQNVRESRIVQRWVRTDGDWYVELGPNVWDSIRNEIAEGRKVKAALDEIQQGSAEESQP